jgi:prepilin-type N-terminal cleavage/methylation domain-containing protein
MIEMKKLNNKGFSLVELIIVIAIMAILVGVVGTQVIPYLEKSRQGKDMQVFSAWNTAGMSAYSMNADKVDSSKPLHIKIVSNAITMENAGGSTYAVDSDIVPTFKELTGLDNSGNFGGLVSREGKTVQMVLITVPVDGATNITTAIYKDTTGSALVDAFGVIENK